MGEIARTPRSSKGEAGFGLTGMVISLLIVALLSVGALKAFGGGAATGSGAKALRSTVNQAYDVQAQSTLSTAMQNVRDGAISNGALSVSALAQYGVTPGPSGSTLGRERRGGRLDRVEWWDRWSARLRECDPGGRLTIGHMLVRLVLVVGYLVRIRTGRHFVCGAPLGRSSDGGGRVAGNGRLAAGIVPDHRVTTNAPVDRAARMVCCRVPLA